MAYAAPTELGKDRTACLVADRSRILVLLLKPGALPDRLPSLAQSAAVRDLDVARIETLVVKEILGRTNVGRSAFYAHFREKDELLASGIHNTPRLRPQRRPGVPTGP